MQTPPKILLIEDNRSIAAALTHALRQQYIVETAATGKTGLYKTDCDQYDAIILDLNLPDVPGLAICQQLRERGVMTPVIILTAETKVLSKINLLDAGANDYLTKPFSLGELKARLRVLTRHSLDQPTLKGRLELGPLSLDTIIHEVQREGQIISLRRKEFSLLECLMQHPNIVISRDALIRYGWQGADTPWTNTIDVHMKYLRDKIDKPFDTPLIKTVHGFGYRLEIPTLKQAVAPQ